MLRELKTFLAVVRHGTFSAAGGAVGLTQSAISTQIRNLEADVGE
ncbi:MAG: LysR family transcriptional regulator, partial [Salinicola sp.]|nr:LysR family transcriptional regulator [Salinicola sp.]